MRLLMQNAMVFRDGAFSSADLSLDGGMLSLKQPLTEKGSGYDRVFDCSGMYIFPGLADVHVHLREPGFSYKETIASGTAAAARGGFTALCTMPNLNPAPDSRAHLEAQLDIIRRTAQIPVYPFACITGGGTGRGELVDFQALAPDCVGFSDDGKGVQDAETMRRAMRGVKAAGRLISAHCEDESLLHGGYIHDGAYARSHGHPGICSESEWGPIARDIALVRETGCPYHVCHVSCGESVDIIRRARAEGLPVSCETAPHYLLLCDEDLQEDGRFKMNPPLRSAADRAALIEGVRDGTIGILATDHAPHSQAEKARGLEKSAFGVVGLETALSAAWTALVEPGIIPAARLAELMCMEPRRRFALGGGEIRSGAPADLCLFDPRGRFRVDTASFASMGRATPFAGMELCGRVLLTVCAGKIVFDAEEEA